MTNHFDIIRQAGILPGHFARYFGYKRVTVSMWVNGRCQPHTLHAPKVYADLALVALALKSELLPVSVSALSGRFGAVERALSKAKELI